MYCITPTRTQCTTNILISQLSSIRETMFVAGAVFGWGGAAGTGGGGRGEGGGLDQPGEGFCYAH